MKVKYQLSDEQLYAMITDVIGEHESLFIDEPRLSEQQIALLRFSTSKRLFIKDLKRLANVFQDEYMFISVGVDMKYWVYFSDYNVNHYKTI